MDQVVENHQGQTCPQCGRHCPADALECGRGRSYFGVAGEEQGCGHKHKHLGGLPGLLHRCGRFVRHSDLEEAELFQALTGEEKAALQDILEKLSASWQIELDKDHHHDHHGHGGGKHHHKHEGHDK